MSVISSMYDPLGMVAPFLLNGRLIMQEASRLNIGWDETIPEPLQERWNTWMNSLTELTKVALDRCIKPKEFGPIVSCQLLKGYGSVLHIKLCNADGNVYCEFLFGKAHVTPLKETTIPRLELMAAVTAVKVNHMVVKTFELPID